MNGSTHSLASKGPGLSPEAVAWRTTLESAESAMESSRADRVRGSQGSPLPKADSAGLCRVGNILVPVELLSRIGGLGPRAGGLGFVAATSLPTPAKREMCAHCRVLGSVRRGRTSTLPQVTRCELATHDTLEDCWIVCGDLCYDVTEFVDAHPGGRRALALRAGGARDCADDLAFHSRAAQTRWTEFLVARLTACAPPREDISLCAVQ